MMEDDRISEEEEFPQFTDEPETEDFDDEFDRLRQKAARAGSLYDEMEMDDELAEEESQGFFSQITPVQRLILLLLLLLDIVVIAVGALAVFGVI